MPEYAAFFYTTGEKSRLAIAIDALSRFLPVSFSVVKTFKYVLNNIF